MPRDRRRRRPGGRARRWPRRRRSMPARRSWSAWTQLQRRSPCGGGNQRTPILQDQRHERQEEIDPGLDKVNQRFSVHVPSLAAQSVQCLLQIGPKVLDVFDPHAQADQVVRNADRLGRVPPSSFNQGLHPAQRGGGQPQLQRADQLVRGVGAAEAAGRGDLDAETEPKPFICDLARSWPGSVASPGNRMLSIRGWVLSRSARTAAEAWERSIRRASVRSPRSASQASKGPRSRRG